MIVDHPTVLLTQAVDLLKVVPGGKYVDATYGRGGHTREIKRRGGEVLTIDVDGSMQPEVVGNFADLQKLTKQHGWSTINGIVFDLGISMTQLMDKDRGFAMDVDGELDMRMDQKKTIATAKDIINLWPVEMLVQIFSKYAQVRQAVKIAHAIVRSRPISTTGELLKVVNNKDESRRVFQALRIAVNDEFDNLRNALDQVLDLLVTGGRVVVIAFHSLEDKIVKDKFHLWEQTKQGRTVTLQPVKGERKSKMRCFEKYEQK